MVYIIQAIWQEKMKMVTLFCLAEAAT